MRARAEPDWPTYLPADCRADCRAVPLTRGVMPKIRRLQNRGLQVRVLSPLSDAPTAPKTGVRLCNLEITGSVHSISRGQGTLKTPLPDRCADPGSAGGQSRATSGNTRSGLVDLDAKRSIERAVEGLEPHPGAQLDKL